MPAFTPDHQIQRQTPDTEKCGTDTQITVTSQAKLLDTKLVDQLLDRGDIDEDDGPINLEYTYDLLQDT